MIVNFSDWELNAHAIDQDTIKYNFPYLLIVKEKQPELWLAFKEFIADIDKYQPDEGIGHDF